MPVHFAGRLCDMTRLMPLARESGLCVIEDCAHAIETTDAERHAGLFGDVAAFSFYVTKNVVTAEGGMLITADDQLAARAKTLGLHGLSADAWKRSSGEGFKHYEVGEPGFKYNMTDIQASLGLHQLRRVESTSCGEMRSGGLTTRHLPIWPRSPPRRQHPASAMHGTFTRC